MDPSNSNGRPDPPSRLSPAVVHDHNRLDFLDLALSSIPYSNSKTNSNSNSNSDSSDIPERPMYTLIPLPASDDNRRTRQPRRKSSRNSASDPDKSEFIPSPYPWASDKRAVVRTINEILAMEITKIGGQVQCRKCDHKCQIQFDLVSKFREVSLFFIGHLEELRHRAPKHLQNPRLPGCPACLSDDCMKPIISSKKRSINWLFLFLGQLLGCCTLEQLKYFCKHTRNHRTGAKNRVLYLAYLGICKQLDPTGPYTV